MPAQKYLPTLDGWRAVAILSVLACHSTGFLFSEEQKSAGNILFRLMHPGFRGVDLFFAISGFLICTRLCEEEGASGKIEIPKFYIRRIFRILPPYLLYLLALFIFGMLGWMSIPGRDLWSCLAFIQNYALPGKEISWYLGHFWSLAIEEHFYLFFPLGLILLGKKSQNRILTFTLLAFGVAIWRTIEFKMAWVSSLVGRDVGFYGRTDIRLDGLLFGVVAALSLKNEALRKKWEDFFRFRSSRILVVILFLIPFFFQFRLDMLMIAFIAPLMLISTLLYPQHTLGRILELPFLRWVGRMSYSLYLWNNFFLPPLLVRNGSFFEWIQKPPFNYLALFSVAALSFYWVERPLVAAGARLTSRQ